jgi:tripartite-type tricarboxylate transporter receptor subunit TctC
MNGSTRREHDVFCREQIIRMRLAATLVIGSLCCCIAIVAYDVRAAAYPERSIKLIVPTTAGSVPDVLARLVGERLAESLGQPVIESRPASGRSGLTVVSAPDGYTPASSPRFSWPRQT